MALMSKQLIAIAEPFPIDPNNKEPLIQISMTTLVSKFINKCHRRMAEMAVDAVLNLADIEKKFDNLERIRIETRFGGRMQGSMLVKGVVVDKTMSHDQMPKTM